MSSDDISKKAFAKAAIGPGHPDWMEYFWRRQFTEEKSFEQLEIEREKDREKEREWQRECQYLVHQAQNNPALE